MTTSTFRARKTLSIPAGQSKTFSMNLTGSYRLDSVLGSFNSTASGSLKISLVSGGKEYLVMAIQASSAASVAATELGLWCVKADGDKIKIENATNQGATVKATFA